MHVCTQEYPYVCAYALYMHRQNRSTMFSAESGGGGWEENKPSAGALRGEQWGDVSVDLYLHRWTWALYNRLVVSPCGALEMLKTNQVCTVSAAGWARARLAGACGWRPWDHAQRQDPRWIPDGSSLHPPPLFPPSEQADSSRWLCYLAV